MDLSVCMCVCFFMCVFVCIYIRAWVWMVFACVCWKILSTLIKNKKQAELQQAVLASPLGISHLMACVADSRELIRNSK